MFQNEIKTIDYNLEELKDKKQQAREIHAIGSQERYLKALMLRKIVKSKHINKKMFAAIEIYTNLHPLLKFKIDEEIRDVVQRLASLIGLWESTEITDMQQFQKVGLNFESLQKKRGAIIDEETSEIQQLESIKGSSKGIIKTMEKSTKTVHKEVLGKIEKLIRIFDKIYNDCEKIITYCNEERNLVSEIKIVA